MTNETVKPGDTIRYIFGLPGPDVTDLTVTKVLDSGDFYADDPAFKITDILVKAENIEGGEKHINHGKKYPGGFIGLWWKDERA